MNLLIDPLPDTVEVGGRAWPINTAFYVGVLFELLMQDPSRTDEDKVMQALKLFYPKIPPDIAGAMDALLWFYRCGTVTEKAEKAGESGGGHPRKAYDFEQDADLVFAAFYGQYHIDLAEANGLHWWKFRALFRGLSPECELVKAMGYRTADLKGMGKAQKKLYEKMRKLYALKNQRSVESTLGLSQRDERMKDYIAKRFAEAGVGETH